MKLVKNSNKEILFTIVLDYKKNNHIYQFWAKNEVEAKIIWAQNIDLRKIGVNNVETIRKQLIDDSLDEDFYPSRIEKLHSVWDASACACSFGDEENYALANIIATLSLTEYINFFKKTNNHNDKQKLFNFSKKEILYTIQLDYKGGTYVDQIFAHNSVTAKFKWVKEFDFNVVYGIPKNIEAIKNNILSNKNDPDFIPQELKEFDSVWSTTVQLGDEVGRVTIVATQTDFLN